jgi:hypothetical protein
MTQLNVLYKMYYLASGAEANNENFSHDSHSSERVTLCFSIKI